MARYQRNSRLVGGASNVCKSVKQALKIGKTSKPRSEMIKKTFIFQSKIVFKVTTNVSHQHSPRKWLVSPTCETLRKTLDLKDECSLSNK